MTNETALHKAVELLYNPAVRALGKASKLVMLGFVSLGGPSVLDIGKPGGI